MNTEDLLLFGGAAAAAWYFFMGPGSTSTAASTAASTAVATGNTSPTGSNSAPVTDPVAHTQTVAEIIASGALPAPYSGPAIAGAPAQQSAAQVAAETAMATTLYGPLTPTQQAAFIAAVPPMTDSQVLMLQTAVQVAQQYGGGSSSMAAQENSMDTWAGITNRQPYQTASGANTIAGVFAYLQASCPNCWLTPAQWFSLVNQEFELNLTTPLSLPSNTSVQIMGINNALTSALIGAGLGGLGMGRVRSAWAI